MQLLMQFKEGKRRGSSLYGVTNRLSGHHPAASFPEHGKRQGKGDILGFKETYITKTPKSKPYQMSFEDVAPNLFAKDGFDTIV